MVPQRFQRRFAFRRHACRAIMAAGSVVPAASGQETRGHGALTVGVDCA